MRYDEILRLRRKPRHDEEDLQIACVRWFDLQYPQYRNLLHHSPNGGKRNVREAARFKAMGTRAGFPDLLLLVPRQPYNFLAIEMKASKGRQSDNQKQMQADMEAQGGIYVVCRSLDEFIGIIKAYKL